MLPNVELEYVSRFAAGDCPFVALPVFASARVSSWFHRGRHAPPSARTKDLEGQADRRQLYMHDGGDLDPRIAPASIRR